MADIIQLNQEEIKMIGGIVFGSGVTSHRMSGDNDQ